MTNDLFLLDLPFEEVDPNGFLVILREGTLAVPLYHAGFAHAAVADNHHLQGHLQLLFPHFLTKQQCQSSSMMTRSCVLHSATIKLEKLLDLTDILRLGNFCMESFITLVIVLEHIFYQK